MIARFFKRLFCRHQWQTIEDGVLVCGGKVVGCISTIRCDKCGKERTNHALLL